MSDVTAEDGVPIVDSDVAQSTSLFIPDTIEVENIPKIGMRFPTYEDAYDFWRNYGFRGGFGTKILGGHNRGGLAVHRIFRCAKEGVSKSKKSENLSTRMVFGVKTKCEAKMEVKLQIFDNDWMITDVFLPHNHKLLPSMVQYMPSHNKIPFHLKKQIEINDEAGLPLACNVKSVIAQGGGVGKVNFTEKKIRNEVQSMRQKKYGGNDAECLVAYFVKMKKEDPDFFYDVKFYDDKSVEHLFWADSRSRRAYEEFSDVVTFDATYGTNRYKLKFCPFVGTNHHWSTILFGCALLATEEIESYVWLFNTWMKCMKNKAPGAIITDQCSAICAAVGIVFPNTPHRYCMWHILRKLPEKIKGPDAATIEGLISETVRYSNTRAEFEEEWKELLRVYELGGNTWLKDMFDCKERWVPAYLKNHFWAGMSTTQRSESMNSFFTKYFNNRTCLKSFVIQYENAIAKMREDEKEEEFRCIDKVVEPFSTLEIEKRYLDNYTLNVFFKFQKEVKALAAICCEVKADLGDCMIYEVNDDSIGENYKFKVFFNKPEKKAACVCRLFEYAGILCRHILCVFKQQRIKKVEDCYIIDRWTKIKAFSHLENTEEGVANRLAAENYSRLYAQLYDTFSNLVQLGAKYNEAREIVVSGIAQLEDRVKFVLGDCTFNSVGGGNGHTDNQEGTSAGDQTVSDIVQIDYEASSPSPDNSSEGSTPVTHVKNPPVASSKGRPRKPGRLHSFRSPPKPKGKKDSSPKQKTTKRKAQSISNVAKKRATSKNGKEVDDSVSPSNVQEDDVIVGTVSSIHPGRPTWSFDMNLPL